MSHVRCKVSGASFRRSVQKNIFKKNVELVGGGSVINRATPYSYTPQGQSLKSYMRHKSVHHMSVRVSGSDHPTWILKMCRVETSGPRSQKLHKKGLQAPVCSEEVQ